MFAIVALSQGCRRGPDELPSARRLENPRSAIVAFEPDDAQVRRLVSAALDGGALGEVRRFSTLRGPSGARVVVVRRGDGWVGALVEPQRATLGLQGAERALSLWRSEGHEPSNAELVRLLGAMHLYPHRVFDGEAWTETPEPRPSVVGSAPRKTRHPGGGDTLLFAYFVASPSRNEGPHFGNFRFTDSGLIIDYAPLPR